MTNSAPTALMARPPHHGNGLVPHDPKVAGSNPAPATTFFEALRAVSSQGLRVFGSVGSGAAASVPGELPHLMSHPGCGGRIPIRQDDDAGSSVREERDFHIDAWRSAVVAEPMVPLHAADAESKPIGALRPASRRQRG